MPILTDEERIGTIVGNKYRLDKILGRGGMGVVFSGVHTGTGRAVAVKLLLPEYARDKEIARRFVREARTAGQLSHRHIVEVLDVGREEDGTVYLVLELLTGETLHEVLARHGTLPPRVAIEMLRPVMDALAHAHRSQIVHRDIKPGNIFMVPAPGGEVQPKLLDFGLAKVVGARASKATRAGSVLGTVEYMSPEQAAGKDDVDGQTDVWSIGVVLYECITGRVPFDAKTPAAMVAAIMTQSARPLSEVAPAMMPALARAIDRALLADRAARYPTMEAFSNELDAVLKSLPSALDDDETTKVLWVRATAAKPKDAVEDADSDAFGLGAKPGASATAVLWPRDAGPSAPQRARRWGLVALGATALLATVGGVVAGLRMRPVEAPAGASSASSASSLAAPRASGAPVAPPVASGAASPGATSASAFAAPSLVAPAAPSGAPEPGYALAPAAVSAAAVLADAGALAAPLGAVPSARPSALLRGPRGAPPHGARPEASGAPAGASSAAPAQRSGGQDTRGAPSVVREW